jgi:hypothetical protein
MLIIDAIRAGRRVPDIGAFNKLKTGQKKTEARQDNIRDRERKGKVRDKIG